MSVNTFSPDDFDVDRETERTLRVALEMTRVALGLTDDHANRIIANRIIEQVGECNPDRLCEGALEKLRGICSGTKTGSKRPDPPPLMTSWGFVTVT